LEARQFPGRVACEFDRVSANIAKRAQGWVAEGTCIEPRCRGTNFAGRDATRIARHWPRLGGVSDLVGSLRNSPGSAIGVGKVAVRIEYCVPIAGRYRHDVSELPASDHLIGKSAGLAEELLAVAKRQLIDRIHYETMSHIEV